MANIISDYQQWKQQGQNLRAQAKNAMELRFRELLTEAIQLAEEYRMDFGVALRPPPVVTAFRYKSQKGKPKQGKPKPAAEGKAQSPEPVQIPKTSQPAKLDPKVAFLERKLATARKKLEAAKSAGSPTKALEDKVYEIEDDIRLAGAKSH